MNTPFYGDQIMLRGRSLTLAPNVKVLNGKITSAVNSVSTLFTNAGVYQVPASKKFIFKMAFLSILTAGTGNSRMSVGYGDNNTGYATGAAAPINAVWAGGIGFTNGALFLMNATGHYEILLNDLECPANKYPCWEAVPDTGNPYASIMIIGYEVNA